MLRKGNVVLWTTSKASRPYVLIVRWSGSLAAGAESKVEMHGVNKKAVLLGIMSSHGTSAIENASVSHRESYGCRHVSPYIL